MRYLTRMRIMTTARNPERRSVAGAVLAMGMKIVTVRLRRRHRAVTKESGKRRVQRMGRGKGR
jgi:thiazole synthase ThiGH ThiG subunit